jgi:hypothetical protein
LEWVFHCDGAPSHITAIVIEWHKEDCNMSPERLVNSPKLSPMEILWAILKKTAANMKPKTIKGLKTTLFAA